MDWPRVPAPKSDTDAIPTTSGAIYTTEDSKVDLFVYVGGEGFREYIFIWGEEAYIFNPCYTYFTKEKTLRCRGENLYLHLNLRNVQNCNNRYLCYNVGSFQISKFIFVLLI